MAEKARLTVPSRVELGESVTLEIEVNSDVTLPEIGDTVEYAVTFKTPSSGNDNSNTIDSISFSGTEGQNVFESVSWTPSGATRLTTITARVEITYPEDGGRTSILEDSRDVQIIESVGEETIVAEEGTGNSSANSLNEFYANRTDFYIDGIVYDPNTPETITGRDNSDTILFEYKNPSITVDSSARFVKHEIIGAQTLRQKVGKDPLEISVDGVCYRDTARRIDGLRYAETGTIGADRFDGSSIDVQFASATTDPLEEGSAVDFTEVNELFNFSLELTEVR
jgi:hypothetical protein